MDAISFNRPEYLWLLVAVPFLAWLGWRSMTHAGWLRRSFAVVVRSAVFAALILALAEVQWVQKSEGLTVIFCLDQSLSIPEQDRRAMLDYVRESVRQHRQKDDRVGVVVFGKEAQVEVPPGAEDIRLSAIEAPLDARSTDLGSAIKLASSMFPENTSRRIVVVSDGNENRGGVLDQAASAAHSGIGIDVVPVRFRYTRDVLMERLDAPSEIHKGQPFRLRVVLQNVSPQPVTGRLSVWRKADGRRDLLSENPKQVLQPGKNLLTVTQQLEESGFYTFEAEFVADDARDDKVAGNNRATAYSNLAGAARVLLIEDENAPGEHTRLIETLKAEKIDVTVRPTTQLFTAIEDLQPFDSVILANVPRAAFSEQQMNLLAENTRDMGAGLVMLGGPLSFGAGGWANTPVEAAMPIDFHIKNLKVVPSGALVLVIDRSGSMSGDKLALSKAAAIAAVKVLGPQDYVGVVAFDTLPQWFVKMKKAAEQANILNSIRKITVGGGTNLGPALEEGLAALAKTDAAVKHLIVLTDGQTEGPDRCLEAVRKRQTGITVSTVSIGDDSARPLLDRMAKIGGGKFHFVRSPRAIPRIFIEEAGVVSRPLVYENAQGIPPILAAPHEILTGISGSPPPVTGFVLTTKKDSPLVEVPWTALGPAAEESPLLAVWQFGLGRAVAFTSDAGARWTHGWSGWESAPKFFAQAVRASLRPMGSSDKFLVDTETKNGRTRIVVTALDEQREFRNFLSMSGVVRDPDTQRAALQFEQTAPGRYEAEFASEAAGGYFVVVQPGSDENGRALAPIRLGTNVPYSPEFRDRESNLPLLALLAGVAPPGSPSGKVIEVSSGMVSDLIEQFNVFRRDLPPTRHSRDAWHWLVIAASVLFFCDVFNRRVSIELGWIGPSMKRVWQRWRGANVPVEATHLDRLKSRKAQLVGEQEESRRFHPVLPLERNELPVANIEATPMPASPKPELAPAAPEPEGSSYTERLLQAKKRALKGP